MKKRRGSKKDPDIDFLSELQASHFCDCLITFVCMFDVCPQAMHSAVGSYMNEDVSQEDSDFFKQAHRTEKEVDELIKEIDEEVPEA